MLTTKQVLRERFFEIRCRKQKIYSILLNSFIASIYAMILYYIPIGFVLKQNILLNLNLTSIMSFFTPAMVGIVGAVGYTIKKYKDDTKAFYNLNRVLKGNGLPIEIKNEYSEVQNINAQIEKKIREISNILFQLQEQKYILESFSDDNKNNLQSSISNQNMIDYSVNKTVNSEHLSSEESFQEEKGSILILRRKILIINNKCLNYCFIEK